MYNVRSQLFLLLLLLRLWIHTLLLTSLFNNNTYGGAAAVCSTTYASKRRPENLAVVITYYQYYRVTPLSGRGVEVFLRRRFSPRPTTSFRGRGGNPRERAPTDHFQTKRVYYNIHVANTRVCNNTAYVYKLYRAIILTLAQ